VEFMLARLQKKRGARAAFAGGFHPPYSEFYLRYGARRTAHFRPGAACPAALLTAARRVFDENNHWMLPPEHMSALDGFLAETSARHELRVYDDALNFMAGVRDQQKLHDLIKKVFPGGAASAAFARLLKEPLHPYQREGALFAARAGRCLIGDDMGLGKTVQAIAAAEILTRHAGIERVLVVCPTSLKHQWEIELARFTGRAALVISGNLINRRRQYADSAENTENTGSVAWKIASYDTLARDLDAVTRWSPDLVIADEAQRIKNWNTRAARTLKRIVSPYAFVLTGTPLENRLEELISIVQFVDQHRLGPTWRLLHEHQQRDEAGRVIGYRKLDAIARTLAPVMIRRRKSEVLTQLPKRVDKNIFVPMTEPQARIHEENREIVGQIVKKWRRLKFLSDADQRRLTCALQNMRMSCDSTWLLDHETDHGVKADELMAVFDDCLADMENDEAKAVVFSQWIGMHEMIARRLDRRNIGYVMFNGSVPAEKRKALIEQFRNDPRCQVFLSTDAGGVGLNLQHAATVVNMDLPWNPAVMEQRIARVHRMGQQRSVRVVNFVAQGTIEESMLSLLGFKRALFAGVLDGGNAEVSLGGTRLSRFMEGVEKAVGQTGTPEVQESATVAEAETAAADKAAPDVPEDSGGNTQAAQSQTTANDALNGLLNAGLTFLTQLAGSSQAKVNGGDSKAASPLLEIDEKTGRRYLRLPMPDPAVLTKLAGALAGLLQGRSKA
jgi:SNF2 family DNA or RNA helicase